MSIKKNFKLIVLFMLICGNVYAWNDEGAWGTIRDYLKRFNTNIIPAADNTYDIGSATREINDMWVDGTADFGDAIVELPNTTSCVSTQCDAAGEAGRICVDTDATSGQRVYVCEGVSGWVVQGAAAGVAGPGSSTDNAIARFDGTDGATLQNSGVTIDDSDNLTVSGQTKVAAGTEGLPGLSATGVNSTGLTLQTNSIFFSHAGTRYYEAYPDLFIFKSTAQLAFNATTIGSAQDSGVGRSAAGIVKITDGGSGLGRLLLHAGNATDKSFRLGASGPGLYAVDTNTIGFAGNSNTNTVRLSHGLGVEIATGWFLNWGLGASGTHLVDIGSGVGLNLVNGTTAQTLNIFGTFTDASNYERLALDTTAGSGVSIAAETAGTGADDLDITLTPAGAGGVGIGVAASLGMLHLDKGTGVGQMTLDGSTGGCLMLRDTDDAGWTECDALDGTLSCSTDADGVCD